MTERMKKGGLRVDAALGKFIADRAAPGTGVDPDGFWSAFEAILSDLGPKNTALLNQRDELQAKIDEWHKARKGQPHDADAYKAFLQEIGYLLPEGGDFTIATDNVDDEIAVIAGPQLVVPVNNARYALNATNARWGRLYDALYGTDVIPDDNGQEAGASYNPARGKAVMDYAGNVLDEAAPLAKGSHKTATAYRLSGQALAVTLADGSETGLAQPEKFAGYLGAPDAPTSVLLRNNGLHMELQIDRNHQVGKDHPAGVKDVLMEAAMTTIQDCEDSVAAVDAEDKVLVYSNWLGLMKGDLEITFKKDGKPLTRRLNPDREFIAPDGSTLSLHGRSLLLVRNAAQLMTSDAVLDRDGNEVPESFLDAMITALIAIHDIKGLGKLRNSRTGSMYVVKPKMHGPE
ncbi:MAG: malate synthase G, partial [Alphaproteobacteria bacterium]|nr:malate synthase G [Alphaproteobacteria bacterium]